MILVLLCRIRSCISHFMEWHIPLPDRNYRIVETLFVRLYLQPTRGFERKVMFLRYFSGGDTGYPGVSFPLILYLKGFLTSYDIAHVAIDPCESNGANPLVLQLTDTQRIRLYGADCNQSALVVRFLTSTLLARVFR